VAAVAPVVDLSPFLDADGDGVHWTLTDPCDLNVNLVRLDPGHSMSEHVNDSLDVVIVVLAGSGRVVVDGADASLTQAVVAPIPKGSVRSIHAGTDGLAYLTVHLRRDPLVVRGHR
jgi:quercetin dioxygenase-like cupin family protein